jgi:flagellar hook-associated protein 3 FlgL
MAITPYVAPFAAGSYAARRSGDLFVSLRRDLDDLQRQLATGFRSETYGGLGLERRTSLDFRGKLAAITGYQDAIKGAELRLTMMTQGIERLASTGRETKGDLLPPRFDVGSDGRTTAQRTAEERLKLAFDILNSEIDGRYLFSGRAQDVMPVESIDRILDGDPGAGRAGLKTLIAERKAADLGVATTVNGNPYALGRLELSKPTAATVRLGDSADASTRANFGFRVLGALPTASGSVTVTRTDPAASNATLAFAATPADGVRVQVWVNGADGVQELQEYVARTTPTAGANPPEFAIGGSAAAAAANLRTAVGGAGVDISGGQSLNPPCVSIASYAGGVAGDVTLGVGAVLDGETVRITLGLRDGTQETIELTAKAGLPDTSTAKEFRIGATAAATADNLMEAIARAVDEKAKTALAAASATLAAQDFFSGSATAPREPRRIAGPPFGSATGFTAVPAGSTVLWYKGDDTAPSARASAPLRVDASQTVATGAQANEAAIRNVVAQFAVLAAETFTTSSLDNQRYERLADKVRTNLGESRQPQKLEQIVAELGGAMATMKGAKERHQATDALLQDTLAGVEQASPEEVAAAILALQTRLQASYQTTSILSRLSIVNYL